MPSNIFGTTVAGYYYTVVARRRLPYFIMYIVYQYKSVHKYYHYIVHMINIMLAVVLYVLLFCFCF